MTDTPEINLEKAVDSAARELFIASVALTTTGRDDESALAAGEAWDSKQLPPSIMLYHRRLALAALTPDTVADIARQVFDAVLESDDLIASVVPENPWATSWDEALKDL